MSITGSILVPATTAAGKTDLWAPSAIIWPDWSTPITIRTSWSTDITTASSAAETRAALTPKPMRSIAFAVAAFSAAELALLRSWLARATMARSLVPLYPDQSELSADALAGDTTIACATLTRRFYVGGRVAIVSPAIDAGEKCVTTAFEIGTIAALDAESITLAAGLAADRPAGSLVLPLIEADLVPELSRTMITDDKATASLTFKETVGAMTLDPILTPGTVPEGVTVYQSLPVMPDFANWGGASGSGVTAGVKRMAEITRVGLTTYTETHGSRFKRVQKVDALSLDRAAAWAMAGWFDALGGQQKVCLAVSPSSDFELSSPPDTGHRLVLKFAAVGASLEWSWRSHLAIVLADEGGGTTMVRGIVSVTRGAGVDTVTFADPWPDELYAEGASVLRIAGAFVARQDSDELVETWRTDQVMSTQLGVVEALEEKSIDLAHIVDPSTGETARAASYSCCGVGVCSFCPPYYWLRWRLADGTIRTVKVAHIAGTCQWKNDANNVLVEKLTGIYWQVTAGSLHWISTVIASCPPVGYKSWAADTDTPDMMWFATAAPEALMCLRTWVSSRDYSRCTSGPVLLLQTELVGASSVSGILNTWYIVSSVACMANLHYRSAITATSTGSSTDYIASCGIISMPELVVPETPTACICDGSASSVILDVSGLVNTGFNTTGDPGGPPCDTIFTGSPRTGDLVVMTRISTPPEWMEFNADILLPSPEFAGACTHYRARLIAAYCLANAQTRLMPFPGWSLEFMYMGVTVTNDGRGNIHSVEPSGVYPINPGPDTTYLSGTAVIL